MNPAIIELLVLAGIAVFLIMRLSSVLGTREGHEKPPLAEPKPQPKRDFQVIDGGEDLEKKTNFLRKILMLPKQNNLSDID